MNYIMVFFIISLLFMLGTDTVVAEDKIKIDKRVENVDEVETATFGLG